MNASPILVTSYMSPDLDGFACAMAYAELLTKRNQPAFWGISGEPHQEAKFLLEKYKIPFTPKDFDPTDFDQIILVDASDLRGIDPRINPDNIIEVIDHRQVNDKEAFKNAKIQIELVGSAATMIAEKFRTGNIAISRESAVLLYGAIISNTLNFQANVTTERDKAAAAWLSQIVVPEPDFIQALFASKSDINQDNLAERLEHDFASFDFGPKVGVAQLEIVHGQKFVQDLKPGILTQLQALKQSDQLDYIFLTVIDLTGNQNIFVTVDSATESLLSSILPLSFRDHVAIRSGFMMRKELIPLIKKKLR